MSRTLRGRRVAYDNIAAGSATGAERTISGDSVSPVEIHGGGFQTSTSTGDVWHSNVEAGSSVTDQVSPATVPENTLAVETAPTNENVG
jgi:hypothetical protein